MEKHTIPEKNLKGGDSITFDQTKDQYIKNTIMGKENKSFKQMDKLTEVDWVKFKRQPFPSKKEKQQSAVDFLLSELNNHLNMPHKHYEEISNQTKELFKQQIEDSCIEFMNTDGIENKKELAEQYFNETFKQ